MKSDRVSKVEVPKNIRNLALSLPEIARDALFKAALYVQSESVKRTPIDTGYLRSSAKTRMENDYTALITYDASYAIFVHERTNVRHNVGEAKFLQKAMDVSKNMVKKILINQILEGQRKRLKR